jgi:arsenate reductase-like glutaredoxin family protein
VAKESLSDADLLELMVKEPRLIRRPVVRIGKDVHFGADAKVLADIVG